VRRTARSSGPCSRSNGRRASAARRSAISRSLHPAASTTWKSGSSRSWISLIGCPDTPAVNVARSSGWRPATRRNAFSRAAMSSAPPTCTRAAATRL